MRKKDLLFGGIAIFVAAVCIRLGVWQLDRLAERRAFNETLRARAELAAIDLSAIPADTGRARFRRVRITGSYDFENEFVIASRVRNGSPGVNIITPLRQSANDAAVLVNRGWVYAPDGMTIDLARWREPREVTADAYVENFRARAGDVRSEQRAKVYRWMDYPTLSREIPYRIAPYYVVLMGNERTPPPNVPPRVPLPPLDEGSHQSYAFQWFSFAAVSIIGMVFFLRRR